MKIALPHVNVIDTDCLPENLRKVVYESFEKFTEGTSEVYRSVDRLLYIDNLKNLYMDNLTSNATMLKQGVREFLANAMCYAIDNGDELPTRDDLLSTDLLESCYELGNRNFCRSIVRIDPHMANIVCTIIKYVMEYPDE